MPNTDRTLSENIRDTIAPGLIVFDVDGTKVGVVESVDVATGWFVARMTVPPENALYIPFKLITTIDTRALVVSRLKAELVSDCTAPPPRTTVATNDGVHVTAATTEPSGYDGSPVVVVRAQTDRLRRKIDVGERVCTSDLVDLGTIKKYDRRTGWMLIEDGAMLERHDLMVPVTAVERVDIVRGQVYLAVGQSDLRRLQHLAPAEVVFAEARAGESR